MIDVAWFTGEGDPCLPRRYSTPHIAFVSGHISTQTGPDVSHPQTNAEETPEVIGYQDGMTCACSPTARYPSAAGVISDAVVLPSIQKLR